MTDTGFADIRIDPIPESRDTIALCMPGAEDDVASVMVVGRKAASDCCKPGCCSDPE